MSISSGVLEEVAALAGTESLLFSMAAVVSPALRTDHILLAAEPGVMAWQMHTEALHLNFWTSNGTRIKVEEPLRHRFACLFSAEDLSEPLTKRLGTG